VWLAIAALSMSGACHRELEMVPLVERQIAFTDRFFDVWSLSANTAFVIGYGGKILRTEDGGASWHRVPSGTEDHALYRIAFADATHGWIVGQDGLILRTTDGGRSWQRQDSDTDRYLFAIAALDRNRAWAVGDRSILTVTSDGGVSIAAQDPVFYDVRFVDGDTGWISGEFGKLLHTSDGGESWVEQQEVLMGDEFFDVLDLPTMFGMSLLNGSQGVAVGIDARIAGTGDAGTSWAWDQVESPYPLLDPFFNAYVFPDGSGWAVGAAGQVVRRRAGESTWHLADLGQPVFTWLRGISFFDAQHGWLVGGFGLILRTTDGGQTWLPCFG
jgi:photosystem II stability/assembly factor-like uncharacterized protein